MADERARPRIEITLVLEIDRLGLPEHETTALIKVIADELIGEIRDLAVPFGRVTSCAMSGAVWTEPLREGV